jgi:DNA polymerase-3 subunit delta'
MTFREIIGQESALAWLTRALADDDIPQSLLFLGPPGVGKVATALALAAATACKEKIGTDSCGKCAPCRLVASSEHPDVVRIAPDGETTKIWQLWTRQGHLDGALENLAFAPVSSPFRHYIFERAETLNDESANSLLKALEEPPAYVRFILCAASRDSVLPTILSRCRAVDFRSVPTASIAALLEGSSDLAPAAALTLARWSEGSPGRAIRAAAETAPLAERERVLGIGDRLSRAPSVAALRLAEELRAGGAKKSKADADADDSPTRGDVGRSIDVLASWFADLLRIRLQGPDAPLSNPGEQERAIAAAGRYSPEELVQCVEHCFVFRRHLARNANAALATEVLFLKLVPGGS